MRVFAAVFCALAICSATAAFNTAEWDQRRKLLDQEAARLKTEYAACEKYARAHEPALDVTVPIETFPDGSAKTTIRARKAVYFLEKGLVWAEGVVVIKVNRDGSENARVDAEHCVVDRYTKSGWAEGRARMRHGKATFSGRGVYFSSPEGYVWVESESDVRSTDLKFGGGGL